MQSIGSIQQLLRQPESTALVGTLLADPTVGTRARLVQELCHRLNLRDPKGDWRIGTTMKALRDLESQGLWELPAATHRSSGKWDPTRLHRAVSAAVGVPARAEEVRTLRLIEVRNEEQSQLWNELMVREHPLHQCRLVGRQLRYGSSMMPALDHEFAARRPDSTLISRSFERVVNRMERVFCRRTGALGMRGRVTPHSRGADRGLAFHQRSGQPQYTIKIVNNSVVAAIRRSDAGVAAGGRNGSTPAVL